MSHARKLRPRVRAHMLVERDGEEREVSVSGVFVPASRGGLYEPPSDPMIEDIVAMLAGDAIHLTEAEERQAELILLDEAWRD